MIMILSKVDITGIVGRYVVEAKGDILVHGDVLPTMADVVEGRILDTWRGRSVDILLHGGEGG